MIRVSTCERCGETRVERDNVTACLGCGELVWPGGCVYFGLRDGRSPKLEMTVLLLRRREIVSREGVQIALWGRKLEAYDNLLHTTVTQLRSRLAAGGFPGAIETVWGKGYRIVLHQPTEAAA